MINHNFLAVFTCLLGLCGLAHADTISIAIDAGILSTAGGTAPLPQGSLLELIASPVSAGAPDGTFTAPTTSSSVTGSDILVAAFGMNYGYGTGETQNTVVFTLGTGAGQIPAGDALLLRWFSGTNYTGSGDTSTTVQSLNVGTTYGQYRSDSPESNETGLTYFVPNTPGATYTFPTGLDFQTVTAGGSNPDTSGDADLLVTPLPEPSTYAMMSLVAVGSIGLKLRQRYARQS